MSESSMQAPITEHLQVIAALSEQIPLLENIADRILTCFKSEGKVILLGNGGSAADAQHIAAELVGRFKRNRRALPALALTTDTSILTAVANDIGAEQIFSRQIEALATKRDIVWALSVSGSSPNIIRGMKAAQRIGAEGIGFTSRKGDSLQALCDLCLKVEHDASDRVQEAHALAYHLICDRVERAYA